MWKMISPRPLREVPRVQLCTDSDVTTPFVQTWYTLNVPMNVHVPQRHSDRSIPPNEQSIKVRLFIISQVDQLDKIRLLAR